MTKRTGHTKDEEVVSLLVADLLDWLNGHGGEGPEALLARDLSPLQREMLLESIQDITYLTEVACRIKRTLPAAPSPTRSY